VSKYEREDASSFEHVSKVGNVTDRLWPMFVNTYKSCQVAASEEMTFTLIHLYHTRHAMPLYLASMEAWRQTCRRACGLPILFNQDDAQQACNRTVMHEGIIPDNMRELANEITTKSLGRSDD